MSSDRPATRRGETELGDGDPMIRQDNTFGTPEEDALRRDFTINSLFYDPRTFQVIDYAGGLDDLRDCCNATRSTVRSQSGNLLCPCRSKHGKR